MRQHHQFYVDKTQWAAKLLKHQRAVLLRPPRMGKTLFISVCKCLFDRPFKEDFDFLFDGLHAHANRLPEFNSFYVLTITLPALVGDLGNYEERFHRKVMSNLLNFLHDHPEILGQMEMDIFSFGEKYTGDCFSALSMIGTLVPHNKLMILVDEYDRAPMDFVANNKDHSNIGSTPVWIMLKDFFGYLKELAAMHNTRYYITGIFTIPGLELSVFNGNEDLTYSPDFASAFGFTETDVRRGLREAAGITNEAEVTRAVDFLRKHANGYNFFRAPESLFNPQLMHRFFQDYQKNGYAKQFPPELIDYNQVFSSNGLQISSHDRELNRLLLKTAASDTPLTGRISGNPNTLDSITYLYQLGVLSLAGCNIQYSPRQLVTMIIPNLSVRRNYAENYLELQNGVSGSAMAFLANPTEETLQVFLNGVLNSKYRWTNEQTEADFQALVTAEILISSPLMPGNERATGGSNQHKTDIRVVTSSHVILIELKTLRGFITGVAASQSLQAEPTKGLGLETTTKGAEYPLDGLGKLAAMAEPEVLAMKVAYTNSGVRYGTVGEVHNSAKGQVAKYADLERESACGGGGDGGMSGESSTADTNEVLAFAVTQVLNRFIVAAC